MRRKMKSILIYDTWNNNTKKVTDVVGTLTLQCGNNGRACGLFWIIGEEYGKEECHENKNSRTNK